MLSYQDCEPLPGICGKRFLTTYLTITGFGVHGDSGDESFKEQLSRNNRCQKGADNVRKKFPEFFGTRRPWVKVPQPGPKPPVFVMKTGGFDVFERLIFVYGGAILEISFYSQQQFAV